MRAWVLILAVLATFKPITQVVSTEGNQLSFHSNKETNTTYYNREKNNSSNINIKNNFNQNVTLSPVIQTNISNSIRTNIINNLNSNKNINNSSSNNINNINVINNYINNYNNNNNLNHNSQSKLDIISINSVNESNNKVNSTSINKKLENHITNNPTSNKIDKMEKERVNNIENTINNIDSIGNSENFHKNSENELKKDKLINKNEKIESNDNNNNNNNNNKNNINYNEDDNINNLETHENGKLKPDPETLVQIETSLLSLFGLNKPPKIDRSKIVIPEAMKRLYAQITGSEFDSVNIPKPGLHTHSANTVRSFTHESTDIDDSFQYHHRFRLYFNVNSIPTDEKLKAAELQISRDKIEFGDPNISPQRKRFRVSVYDILKIGSNKKNNINNNNNNYNDQRDTSYLLLDTKTIYTNSSETLSLDVHSAVNRWLESPEDNNGLLIEVKSARNLKPAKHNHVRLRRSLDEADEEWLPKQPLLFTYTDDGRHKTRLIRDVSQRSKRAHSRGGHHRRKNSICQRRPLFVDFNDVGWSDWIVAPPGYDAYYCQGDCPFPLADHLNSTNHAVVQTLVNNITPAKVPKACCIPTQLSAISMLYLNDQNQVVLKNYQDMSVVGCGCR